MLKYDEYTCLAAFEVLKNHANIRNSGCARILGLFTRLGNATIVIEKHLANYKSLCYYSGYSRGEEGTDEKC